MQKKKNTLPANEWNNWYHV